MKLVKLLKSLIAEHIDITLISDTDTFLFLPLVPDYISGKIRSLSCISTSIPEFCRQLQINFIHGKFVSLDELRKQAVVEGNISVAYDICILCTGRGETDNHKRILFFLDSLNKEYSEYHTKNVGLAEFEIMSALEEVGKDVTICTSGRHQDLDKHWLRETLMLNGQEDRFRRINNFIKMNSVKSRRSTEQKAQRENHQIINHALVIGAAMNNSDGEYPSAQRSSQNAHIAAYCIGKNNLNDFNLKQDVERRLKQYRSRGEMIFVNSNYALIWLGDRRRSFPKATFSGFPASIIRRFFYRIEFWLYYQINGAPKLLCRLLNRSRI